MAHMIRISPGERHLLQFDFRAGIKKQSLDYIEGSSILLHVRLDAAGWCLDHWQAGSWQDPQLLPRAPPPYQLELRFETSGVFARTDAAEWQQIRPHDLTGCGLQLRGGDQIWLQRHSARGRRLPVPGQVGRAPLAVAPGFAGLRHLLAGLDLRGPALAADMALIAPVLHQLGRQQLAAPLHCRLVEFGPKLPAPRCSIVVPLHGRIDFLAVQAALFAGGALAADQLVYVLDDPDLQADLLDLAALVAAKYQLSLRLVLPDQQRGFGPACNLGLAHATGTYVCFLNSDVFPMASDWLDQMLLPLQQSGVGAVGARLLFPDGSVQHDGMQLQRVAALADWYFPQHPGKGLRPDALAVSPPNEVSDAGSDRQALSGACMVMRRDLALDVAGFDPAYLLADFEDADLCLRLAERGLRCQIAAGVTLYHLERGSQPGEPAPWRWNLTLLNAWMFEQRWGDHLRKAEQAGA